MLLAEDRSAFLSLPVTPLDACRKVSTAASSLSLVRFDKNDYSVPVRWAHHPIVAKGYVDKVVLCHGGVKVAEHVRCWGKERVLYDWRHYLPLLERKPGSLDHALPLADLELPECFDVLRRRLESQEGRKGEGTREYIQVLRLLEEHAVGAVKGAVEKALRVRKPSRDVVAMFLIPQRRWQPMRFTLEGREHLSWVKVAKPELSAYGDLLLRGGSS